MSLSPEVSQQIEVALREGKKIEAIKLLREATGIGLKEAKETIEAFERGESPSGDLPGSFGSPPPDVHQRVVAALQDGNKIGAIKIHREETGQGLAESKRYVEGLEKELGPATSSTHPHATSKGCAISIFLIAAGGAGLFSCLHALGQDSSSSFEPEPLAVEDFSALEESSPFLRTLNLSDSLILTGLAQVEGDLFATLLDRETKETHILSRHTNSNGWRLVEVRGDRSDLETVTAQVSVSGGEVFSIRFNKDQLDLKKATPGSSSGDRSQYRGRGPSDPEDYRNRVASDGFPGPPPPDMVEKLSRLSKDMRARVVKAIYDAHQKDPSLSSETRQKMFRGMVDRALRAEGR